jgi:hypothetical protein
MLLLWLWPYLLRQDSDKQIILLHTISNTIVARPLWRLEHGKAAEVTIRYSQEDQQLLKHWEPSKWEFLRQASTTMAAEMHP